MSNSFIDEKIVLRDGPFEEFKQDASVVSVELRSGEKFHKILLLYPNQIIGMQGKDKLPFEPLHVKRVFQSHDDLSERANMSWVFSKTSGTDIKCS